MRKDNVMELPLFLVILEITFIVVGDAVHPGCQCVVFAPIFRKEKAVFKSPDYPTPYLPNIDCLLYSFQAGPEEIVEIMFEDFNIYRDKSDCLRGDYLKVFVHLDSASINEYTPWESVYCGNMVDIPSVIYSSGPGLVLEFHSGPKITNSTGFTGSFSFIDKRLFRTDGILLLNTMCDYQFLSGNENPTQGKFYSPRYPSSYPKNIGCTYRFRARYKERIRIVFEEVFLQRGDLSCFNREDLIRVYDGKTSSDPAISIICNEGNELEVSSTGSELFIEFVANSDTPGQGFKARYQFEEILDVVPIDNSRLGGFLFPIEVEPSVSEARSSCNMSISSDSGKSGIIMTPNYPSPYPSSVTCIYEFQGKGKERVQIIFQDFNLYYLGEESKNCDHQDGLNAFVHIDGRMEKIDSFCGSSLPKNVMSNGLKLKLEFQSRHQSRYSRGFKATYRFIEDFDMKTGFQLPNYPCAFEFLSNVSKEGYFHSPNFPGFYPRQTECHYFFQGFDKEKVHLHFNYFDVEGVTPCQAISASDYVEFSNFHPTDRKYQRHCGQLQEFDVESDRKFFRVTFKSNERLDGTGFNATYQFLDVIDIYKPAPTIGRAPGTFLGNLLLILSLYLMSLAP
ncbi:hypothetical protein ABEB36_012134 [Hypothenemus hampei]|uniref:CUB domain-containing protein n=1 Tax=Hypothenemus hampei TaxID=57062 RepID=A0ABD1EAF8_HYPHA